MDNEIPSCGTVAFMALFVIFVVIIDLWSQKKPIRAIVQHLRKACTDIRN